jgi:hypothetical protein
LNSNEKEKFQSLSRSYKNMYIDAFVATMQCECLKYCLKFKNSDESIEQDDTQVGSAILMCWDNFQRNNQDFGLKDGADYTYRNIQKDSIRCLLILITIYMKKFIIENKETPKE